MQNYLAKTLVTILMKSVQDFAGSETGKNVLSKSKLLGVLMILFGVLGIFLGQDVVGGAALSAGVYAIVDRNSRIAENSQLLEQLDDHKKEIAVLQHANVASQEATKKLFGHGSEQ
jgi:hypothetical protein